MTHIDKICDKEISMNTANERIAMNSRKKLTQALFIVMKQYPYKEITITQIAQEAELSRKTFYRLYTSKDDILNEYVETLLQSFATELGQRSIHHYWDVVQLYFDFWEQREDVIMLFKEHGLLPILMEATLNFADKVFVNVRSVETYATFSPMMPYMLAYSVAGMHSMLISWLTNGKTVPSNILIQNIKEGFHSPEI